MSSNTTIRQIAKNDLNFWDGVTPTWQRLNSTGGFLTARKFGYDVDICEAYGDGTAQNSTTLLLANNAIGSREVCYNLSPGTWSITENVTIPANVTLKIPQGTLLSVATGITLTINGPVEAGIYQLFSLAGTGFVKFSNEVREIMVEWFIPPDASDHTSYIKLAIDSTSHLVSGGFGKRPPVILTRADYNIADMALDMSGSYSYVGMSLIGKPGGGNNESVTLNVTGAATNGILLSGNTSVNSFANYCTLENITIAKDNYPGDNNGDYGLKCRNVQFLRTKNVKVKKFGDCGLFLQETFFAWHDGFEAWNCYRGINSTVSTWGANWGCTTHNFVNPLFYDCKTHIYVSGGRAHMTFNGLVSDVNVYATSYVIDFAGTTTNDIQLYFEQGWFEGMGTGKIVRCGGATTYPYYNQIVFRDSVFSSNTKDELVTSTGTGSALVTFDGCMDVNAAPIQAIIVPNRTDGEAYALIAAIDDGTATDPMVKFLMSTKECDNYLCYGANSTTILQNGISAFNGVFHHRLIDSTHLTYAYTSDVFRSSAAGFWLSTLRLQQSGAGYGTETHISRGARSPVSSTCNGAVATPYRLDTITNIDQYAAGDDIRVAGAGAAGANLDTIITNIDYDGLYIYIKDAIQTTVNGAALNLNSTAGDIKLNTSPAGTEYIGWVCITDGFPGTWKGFGAIEA